MTARARTRQDMVSGMTPVLCDGRFVFVTVAGGLAAADDQAIARFQEAEGVSYVLPVAAAAALGLKTAPEMAQITLNVFSDLEGVGLTAAVSETLAQAGIPANVVAAYHHDHVFVPEARAGDAMDALKRLQADAV